MAFKGVEHELKLTEDELLVLRANVNTQQGSTAKISAKKKSHNIRSARGVDRRDVRRDAGLEGSAQLPRACAGGCDGQEARAAEPVVHMRHSGASWHMD